MAIISSKGERTTGGLAIWRVSLLFGFSSSRRITPSHRINSGSLSINVNRPLHQLQTTSDFMDYLYAGDKSWVVFTDTDLTKTFHLRNINASKQKLTVTRRYRAMTVSNLNSLVMPAQAK